MSISLSCPQCERRLSVAESAAGKKVKCPRCSGVFVAAGSNSAFADLPPLPPDEPPAPRRTVARTQAGRRVAAPSRSGKPAPAAEPVEKPRRQLALRIIVLLLGILGALSAGAMGLLLIVAVVVNAAETEEKVQIAIQFSKAMGEDTSMAEQSLRERPNLKRAACVLTGVAGFGFLCVIITMFGRGQFTGLALLMAIGSAILIAPKWFVIASTGILILVALLSLLIFSKRSGDGRRRSPVGGVISALFASCVGIGFLAVAILTLLRPPGLSAAGLDLTSTKPAPTTAQSAPTGRVADAPQQPLTPSTPPQKVTTDPSKISSKDLVAAYLKDMRAAEKTYGDRDKPKELTIEGVVVRLDKAGFGDGKVAVLEGTDKLTVQSLLSFEDEKRVKVGEKVTIQGNCRGMLANFIDINGGKVVKEGAEASPPRPAADSPRKPATDSSRISSKDLVAEYLKNKNAAEKKYGNPDKPQELTIEGIVVKIDKAKFGSGKVAVLEGTDKVTVQSLLLRADEGKVKVGEKATIRGNCRGLFESANMIDINGGTVVK